jgi:hypothetical protein
MRQKYFKVIIEFLQFKKTDHSFLFLKSNYIKSVQ